METRLGGRKEAAKGNPCPGELGLQEEENKDQEKDRTQELDAQYRVCNSSHDRATLLGRFGSDASPLTPFLHYIVSYVTGSFKLERWGGKQWYAFSTHKENASLY